MIDMGDDRDVADLHDVSGKGWCGAHIGRRDLGSHSKTREIRATLACNGGLREKQREFCLDDPALSGAFGGCRAERFGAEEMDAVRQVITVKKAELDRLRGVASVGPTNLEQVYDVELTYKSNAIEGNTVTASETMQVIEHRITVSGKPLKDHLEAIDHFEVIRCVRDLAR